jgi:soluble lytic murein transglycosylase
MVLHKSYKRRRRFFIGLILIVGIVALVLNSASVYMKMVYPQKFGDYVLRYAAENSLDPYLVFSMMKAESSFDPKATSRKNARGLMQITEMTGKWGAEKLKLEGYSFDSLYEPETNIRIGCWYLKRLMYEFNQDLDLVIAAYNGGSGNVREWLKDPSLSESGSSLDRIPFQETALYLKKVKKYHSMYKRLYENR